MANETRCEHCGMVLCESTTGDHLDDEVATGNQHYDWRCRDVIRGQRDRLREALEKAAQWIREDVTDCDFSRRATVLEATDAALSPQEPK